MTEQSMMGLSTRTNTNRLLAASRGSSVTLSPGGEGEIQSTSDVSCENLCCG